MGAAGGRRASRNGGLRALPPGERGLRGSRRLGCRIRLTRTRGGRSPKPPVFQYPGLGSLTLVPLREQDQRSQPLTNGSLGLLSPQRTRTRPRPPSTKGWTFVLPQRVGSGCYLEAGIWEFCVSREQDRAPNPSWTQVSFPLNRRDLEWVDLDPDDWQYRCCCLRIRPIQVCVLFTLSPFKKKKKKKRKRLHGPPFKKMEWREGGPSSS